MALSPITALPTPPSRGDAPATFNPEADAFMAAWPTMVTEFNQALSEIPAAVNGINYSGTSTTSVAIGTGSKSFTTQAGKNFTIGQSVRVAYTTTPANYMDGQVTAYNSGTGALTVNVAAVGGAGTWALWTISLAVASSSYYPTTGGTVSGPIVSTGTISPGNLSNFYLQGSGTSAVINFDSNDYLSYDRTGNALSFAVGGVNGLVMNASLATFGGAIKLAAASGTTAGNVGYTGGVLSFGDGSAQQTVATLAGTQTLTNKTLTSPVINGGTCDSTARVLDTGTIAANSTGYRGLPVSSNATGTLALTDAGKMLIVSSNQTIPANASVAFPIGTTIMITNNSGSTITVAITTDTLRLAGSATTGTRTIAVYGECALVKITSTVWLASGNVT